MFLAALPVLLIVISLLAFWKAEAVGRAVQQFDQGKLGRSDTGAYGAGPQAYVFFVRLASGILALLMAAPLIRALLS